jgi:transcriptional regulator with XRE-family HTH domain
MNDQRVGSVLRAVRMRRGWRQSDLAAAARVSSSLVSQIERGHLGNLTFDRIRRVSAALEIRLDLIPRWRGGELDRLINSRHAALTEAIAARIAAVPGWRVAPEVSFSIFGERGSIDLLAWHEPTRTLLVIEVKTEIVDLQELLGVLDRKTRLAEKIGRDRGWTPAAVSTWLVVAEGTSNRNRLAQHRALIRSALPASGHEMRRWLVSPSGRISACSFLPVSITSGTKRGGGGTKRVRKPRPSVAESGSGGDLVG